MAKKRNNIQDEKYCPRWGIRENVQDEKYLKEDMSNSKKKWINQKEKERIEKSLWTSKSKYEVLKK